MSLSKVVVFLIVCFCASSALALAPMGPTTAGLEPGKWAFGAEYADVDMQLDRRPDGSSGLDYPDDMAFMKMDTEVNQYSILIRRGLLDWWEGYARVGLADMEYKAPRDSGNEWEGDDEDIFLGLGSKMTLWEQTPELKWGFLAQVQWYEWSGSRTNPTASHPIGKFEAEITEWQIAVGPTWTPEDLDWLTVYGGAFFHDVDGYQIYYHESDGSEVALSEGDDFGLYIGAQFAVKDNVALTVEYMDTDEADAFVVGAMWTP